MTENKASIWLALKNPDFRKYWLAALISGTCVAANNTAVFSLLGKLHESALVISLMSTVSSLPFALFTLPAGALADIVDRKRMLCATNLWQTSIALGLATLGFAHLLNPYIILTSSFLFGLGFAFGAPASSSIEVGMVPKEHLASAGTLGGLKMNISGIIGPLLGGLLIPIVGTSYIFGANALGFLLLLSAILTWKRPQQRKSIVPEHFFATIIAAVRYVIYTPGMKVILTRLGLFSFFISIIPSLMPVVGLKELHLDASKLGYLFTALAVGSVVAAVFLVPLARARFSPNKLIIYAYSLLVSDLFLMAFVRHPYVFLLVAALGGAGWTLAASELYIAGQRAMPEWARGRMSATTVMVGQAATALGGVVWGTSAATAGVVHTFLVAGFLAILAVVLTQVILRKRFSVDFTTNLNLEPAAVTIFSRKWDPIRLSYAKENPVSVVTEFTFDSAHQNLCVELLREVRLIYLRNGARDWHLYEDYVQSARYQMEVTAPSWIEYQRLHERLTKDEKAVLDKLHDLHRDQDKPREFIRVSVNKSVIKRNREECLENTHDPRVEA
ncbi:MAG TPA: MFS transporter [Chthoniobacterales bacterium]